ncbi:MAG TPA: ABC transporter ATP-binding protein [Dermatophilaceae bacterium]|nr:ABC transporter ATP-binding protein [Dermatophilaceae bacterium]
MLLPLLLLHLRPYRRQIRLIVGLQLASTLANLYLPSLNGDIIDRGVSLGDTAYIARTGALMLAISVVQAVSAVGAVYYGAQVAMAMGRDLRAAVFAAVESFAAKEMGRFGAPSLITRTTNDVQQVQLLVLLTFTMMIAAPIMCVGGVVMALRQDVQLSGLILVVVPVLVVGVGLVIAAMRPLFRAMQAKIDTINRVLREQLTGVRVIRAFVREPHEARRFDLVNRDLTGTAVAVGKLMAVMFPLVMGVMNLSSIAVLWFGGHRIADGDLAIGTLVAFLSYLMQILMSVMMATFMFMLVPRAEVSAERITEVLQTTPSVAAPERPTPRREPVGRVELRGASFAYPGAEEPVLHGVDLVAEPGRTTAVVGSTGSGKSTLLNLVPRLFDATGGAVLVDGVDVRDLAPEDLWSSIGLVPQRAYLFAGTIASNLRYGAAEATDAQLWAALDIAAAREFVEAMPGGLDAAVGQGGANLSGGQRQRLAIARAVVRQPTVYLFDDAFSALDYATDARVRAALAPVTGHATVLVVAQRVSTIRDADQIVVLDQGRVVGTGTHHELMTGCPTYRELVLSQLTEEEAA